jgi:hypothetical protein
MVYEVVAVEVVEVVVLVDRVVLLVDPFRRFGNHSTRFFIRINIY